jgi:hypothetical protein
MAGTLIQKLKALAHHGIGGDKNYKDRLRNWMDFCVLDWTT